MWPKGKWAICFLAAALVFFPVSRWAAAQEASSTLQPGIESTPEFSLLLAARDDAEQRVDDGAVEKIDRQILAVALRRLGEIERSRGNLDSAQKLDRQATELDHRPLLQPGALASAPLGLAAAQSLNKQTADLESLLGATYNSLGTALAHEKKLSEARQAYLSAMGWCPETQGLDRNLGLLYIQLEEYSAAVAPLTRVLQANPGDVPVQRALGLGLFETGRRAEGLATLKPIADQLKSTPTLAYMYAVAMADLEDKKAAQSILDSLLIPGLPPQLAFVIGQELVVLQDDVGALKALHLAEGPDAPPRIHYFEAMVALRLNDLPKAISLLEMEMKSDPKDLEAEFDLAYAQLYGGDRRQAILHLTHVLAEQPSHATANYELGKVWLEQGMAAKAIPFLEAAEKSAPNEEYIHYSLELAYHRVGRETDSERELQLYKTLRAESETQPPPAPGATK
jgi:tetratricopeptide (TPR) repeat protein